MTTMKADDTMDQLRQNLKNAGASEEALRSQITASIAWQKAVQDEYGDQVNITPEMVNAELQRHAERFSAPEATQPMYLKTEPQPLAPALPRVP